jgi:hypothetical protein
MRKREARVGDIVKVGRTGVKLYALEAIVRSAPGLAKRYRRPATACLSGGRRVKLDRLRVVKAKAGK